MPCYIRRWKEIDVAALTKWVLNQTLYHIAAAAQHAVCILKVNKIRYSIFCKILEYLGHVSLIHRMFVSGMGTTIE